MHCNKNGCAITKQKINLTCPQKPEGNFCQFFKMNFITDSHTIYQTQIRIKKLKDLPLCASHRYLNETLCSLSLTRVVKY